MRSGKPPWGAPCRLREVSLDPGDHRTQASALFSIRALLPRGIAGRGGVDHPRNCLKFDGFFPPEQTCPRSPEQLRRLQEQTVAASLNEFPRTTLRSRRDRPGAGTGADQSRAGGEKAALSGRR